MSSRIFFAELFSLPTRICRKLYFLVNPTKFRLVGIRLGKRAKIYNKIYLDIHSGSEVTIGDDFTLTSGAAFNPLCRNLRACICAERPDSVIRIGHHVGMSSPCLWAKQSITIGNYVNIGGDCIIMDSDAHNLDWRVRASEEMFSKKESMDGHTAKCAPITIEDHVLIGTRCIILKGVTIRARSIIAAGSVVTKDIPADCIAGGNPCRVIRKLGNLEGN